MEGKDWENVSSEAKDLVTRMLTVDPERRITTAGTIHFPSFSSPKNDDIASLHPKENSHY